MIYKFVSSKIYQVKYILYFSVNLGENDAGRDTCSTSSSRQDGLKKAARENIVTNTAAEATAPGDALCTKSLQHGVHILGRFGACSRFYNKGTGDTATSRTV